MRKLNIYTDGSCLDNASKENYGGWAFVVDDASGVYYDYCGAAKNTTNNQMEMTAVIEALRHIRFEGRAETIINIYSDSAYVVNCFTAQWYVGWMKNGWKNAKGKPVENKELWETMISLVNDYAAVNFKKVIGHSDDELNNKCDELCTTAAQKFKAEDTSKTLVNKVFEDLPNYKSQSPVNVKVEKPANAGVPCSNNLDEIQKAIDILKYEVIALEGQIPGVVVAEWLENYKKILEITGGVC